MTHLTRAILRPVAFLAARHADRQKKTFLAAHRQTRQVQDTLLAELVAHHADTTFGHDHGFSNLRSYEDFKAAVPVRDYEGLRPWMQRVFDGDSTAMFRPGERILMFSQTSGTTGEPKHIPVTRRFLEQIRAGWNIFGLLVLNDHPSGWLRPILQITSPMCETTSPTGVPCGAISGLLAEHQKSIVRRMYVVRPGVSAIPDAGVRYYTTLRCGVGRDVGIITTANPSSIIKLIESGQEHTEQLIRDVADGTTTPPGGVPKGLSESLKFKRNRKLALQMEQGVKQDGLLLPHHFWNVAFLTSWTGGTLKLYLPRLKELFGKVPIRDIGLVASEGRFSLPTEDHTSAGLAEITGNFLEFIPAEDCGRDDPPTLRADELEIGGEYSLVVTNWAGLWRYNIDDRVRVTDRYGDSPVFEFLSRGVHTANITGEKITEHQVVEAMRRAGRWTGGAVERFVLQGKFASQPYYQLSLEAADDLDVGQLAEHMDEMLCELNMEYRSKRKSDRLGPIKPILLPAGSFVQHEARSVQLRGGRSEQYKHQYLMTDVLTE